MTGEVAGQGVDRGSLSELYVAYAPDGIRLAFLLTGDRALAEDLVQDAFVHLVGRLRHLRETDAFWSYLRRMIVNLAISHFGHRRVERAYLERLASAPSAVATPTTIWTSRCIASSLGCPSDSARRSLPMVRELPMVAL
jgi:RNA polymerase sigma factor (sigma-70 family)